VFPVDTGDGPLTTADTATNEPPRQRSKNVRTVRHQQFEDIIHVRNATQQEESMQTPDPIQIVRIALRLSLAAGFLSAVADRFGWWKPFGQGSWGSMGAFADYTHQLVPFASGWLLTVIVWAATATETTLAVLLLTGWRPKLVGAATCLTLIVFGTAMAVSLGMESPLSYSVFSAASAAAAYAILGTTWPPHTTDTTHPEVPQK
jgi:uncharacterized membrane protein YphA (DoxX/SURF4 family)